MPATRTIASLLAAAALAAAFVLSPATHATAQTTGATQVRLGPSGLPLPRFVSLKSPRVNLRVGPGTDYAVDWVYVKAGLPVEIVQEYDNWRRVRDPDGTEGWVNQSLLSGARTGIVAPWQRGTDAEVALMAQPSDSARKVARLQSGLIGTIRSCDGNWCEMEFSGVRGWVRQARLWGAYPGETYRD